MRNPKELVKDIPELMREWDYEKNNALGILPDKLGSQSNTYAYWVCKYGHRWKAKINNRYNGRGCPECQKRLHSSFPEQAVYFYVKQKYPEAINSYKDCFKNGMELDVYIPSLHVGVEYDGKAWHGDDALQKERRKYEICRQNEIKLIRIKEDVSHYRKRNELNIADDTILMRQAFSGSNSHYSLLDAAIRQLLAHLRGEDDYLPYLQLSFNESDVSKMIESGPFRFFQPDGFVDSKRDKNKIHENYLVTLENNSLGHLFPDVAKMWHPTLNGNLTPFMFSANSNVRVWWIGECGHEWENPVGVMTRGYGCPYCAGQRVLKGFNDLQTLNPEIASQWHPSLNGEKTPDMFTVGSGYKAYWLCKKCGQSWRTAINNRTVNKRGCPYCAQKKAITGVNDLATLRPDLLEEWDYDKNGSLDPKKLLLHSNRNVWWRCSKCGHEYQALINNRTKGIGCANCAGKILIPGVNDLQTLYPDVAKEWDIDKNNGILPSEVFPHSQKRYYWRCSLGHSWLTKVATRTHGRGCPICSGNVVLEGFNDLATTHPDVAAQWHPTLNGSLLPTQVSKGHNKKVWFKCPVCGNAYETLIPNKLKGFGGCPFCSPRKTRARFVLQVETGKVFNTLKEAANSLGSENIKKIQACCKGKCNTAFDYHWEYVNEEDIHKFDSYRTDSLFEEQN